MLQWEHCPTNSPATHGRGPFSNQATHWWPQRHPDRELVILKAKPLTPQPFIMELSRSTLAGLPQITGRVLNRLQQNRNTGPVVRAKSLDGASTFIKQPRLGSEGRGGRARRASTGLADKPPRHEDLPVSPKAPENPAALMSWETTLSKRKLERRATLQVTLLSL